MIKLVTICAGNYVCSKCADGKHYDSREALLHIGWHDGRGEGVDRICRASIQDTVDSEDTIARALGRL